MAATTATAVRNSSAVPAPNARELMEKLNADAVKAQRLGPHRDERPFTTGLVRRRRWRDWRGPDGCRPCGDQPDQDAADALALAGLRTSPASDFRYRQPGRRVSDRICRPAKHPAHQSRPWRPAPGDEHHALCGSVYNPGDVARRTSTATPAARFCRTTAVTPVSGRALRRKARRPDPDPERHLARSRQRFRHARDLDRHA